MWVNTQLLALLNRQATWVVKRVALKNLIGFLLIALIIQLLLRIRTRVVRIRKNRCFSIESFYLLWFWIYIFRKPPNFSRHQHQKVFVYFANNFNNILLLRHSFWKIECKNSIQFAWNGRIIGGFKSHIWCVY